MARELLGRREVVWYPAAGDCAVFIGVGKRWVERLLAISVKRYERANQNRAAQRGKKKAFHNWAERNHVLSLTPLGWRPMMTVVISRWHQPPRTEVYAIALFFIIQLAFLGLPISTLHSGVNEALLEFRV
jgi:hypothetical protein